MGTPTHTRTHTDMGMGAGTEPGWGMEAEGGARLRTTACRRAPVEAEGGAGGTRISTMGVRRLDKDRDSKGRDKGSWSARLRSWR